jgi:phosphate-selective porin OprO/OprP
MLLAKRKLKGILFAGTAGIALTAAHAEHAQAGGTSGQGADDAKIQQLEQDIQDLQSQVQDLKRSTADQYTDVQNQQAKGVKVAINNGRPTITGDDFTFSLRSLVQYDSAYYGQGQLPAGTDFSSGNNFRRARLGFEGTAFKDWSYQFIYDFGGSGIEASTVSAAYIQYNGLAPVHVRAGAFPPSESFEDTTSASDLLFLERSQPTDLARSIAGSDGRDAAQVFAYDDNYFVSAAYTAGLVGDAATFDEQQAVVARAAYRVVASDTVNLAFGADTTYVFKFPDLTAGDNSAHAFRLRERPELNVDSEGIRLIDTNNIDADHGWEWGVEAAGNYENFYGQGGYFGFEAMRRDLGNPLGLSDPNFNGWYIQASWVLTGELRKYKPDTGSWGAPKPNDSFSLDKPGVGAWELAARYSDLNLDYHAGQAGLTTPLDGIRGGDQRIWSAGINWYPNQVIRLMLDYQHTDVSRLSATGGSLDGTLDDVSLRLQLSL